MSHKGVGFELVEVGEGYRCSLYSVQFNGSDETELEKLASDDEITSHPEFGGVFGALVNIPYEEVPPGYKFKVRGYRNSGWITPFVEKGFAEVRIYCIKHENCDWVIAGNGCIKTDDGPLQNFDRCRKAFNDIEYVEKRLDRRLRGNDPLRDITPLDDKLIGDLYFESNP